MRLSIPSALLSLAALAACKPVPASDAADFTGATIISKLNLTPAQFASEYDILTAYMYTITSFSTHFVKGDIRLSAVFSRPMQAPSPRFGGPAQPSQLLLQNLSQTDLATQMATMGKNGYTTEIIDTYSVGENDLYSAVFRLGKTGSVPMVNLDKAGIEGVNSKYLSNGKYRVSSLSCNNHATCALILDPSSGGDDSSVILHELQESKLTPEINNRSGMKPSVLSAYTTKSGLLYTTVLEKGGETVEKHLLSEEEYIKANDEIVSQGKQVYRLAAYEVDGQVKYAATWR